MEQVEDISKMRDELIEKLKIDIAELVKLSETKVGYVVEGKYHVHVPKELGLKDTSFEVKAPATSALAVVYESREDAEKYGMDYYLQDGKGRPIYLVITPAGKFFKREAKEALELLNALEKQKLNNS